MKTALDVHVHTDEHGVSTLDCDVSTDEHGVTTLHVNVEHDEESEHSSDAEKAIDAIQESNLPGATPRSGGLAEIEAIQAANKTA